jgi:predicted CopG family antitoxin
MSGDVGASKLQSLAKTALGEVIKRLSERKQQLFSEFLDALSEQEIQELKTLRKREIASGTYGQPKR